MGSKAWGRLTEVEKARDAAELALHRVADEAGVASSQVGQEASLHIAVARERQNAEVKRAQRTVADDRSLKAQAAEREQAVSTELARRDQEAQAHQRLGAKR